VVLNVTSLMAGDERAFSGSLVVGVAEPEPALPWLVVRFMNGLGFDGPVLIDGDGDQGWAREGREGNVMTMVATVGPDHVVVNLRLLGLHPDVVRVLRRALEQRDNVRDLVEEVMRRVPSPDEMMERAVVRQVFDRGE
jgi:hypothetical protein